MVQNTYLPPLVKQLANSIVVDALNNLTGSVYTSCITLGSASLFVTSSVFSASNAMTTNEVPFNDRMIICTPNAYQSLISNINPAYVYGASTAIQDYHGIKLGGFDPIFEYPRLVGTVAKVGGDSYSQGFVSQFGSGGVLAFALQKQALVIAMRAPVDVMNGLVQTSTATDPTSGVSIQVRIMYDIPRGVWKLAATSIFGTQAGNPKAAIVVGSTSTY